MSKSRELDELLDSPAEKKREFDIVATASDTGPGVLDTLACFMEGDENCWVTFNASIATKPKRKIILADPIDRGLELVDIRLLNHLIEHFETYALTKLNQPINQAKPLSSASDFFTLRAKMPFATKADIKKILAAQGVADDYIILDHAEYHELLKKYAQQNYLKLPDHLSKYAEDYFDLSDISLEQAVIHKRIEGVDCNAIKTLKILTIPTRGEVAWIKKTFPNLKRIEIEDPRCTWQNSQFPHLSDYEVAFLHLQIDTAINAHLISSGIRFPGNVRDYVYTKHIGNRGLTLNNIENKSHYANFEDIETDSFLADKNRDFLVEVIKKLTRLKIKSYYDTDYNEAWILTLLENNKNLRNFEICNSSIDISTLLDSKALALEKLILENSTLNNRKRMSFEINGNSYPKLKSILIDKVYGVSRINNATKSFHFESLTELEELIIQDCPSLKFLELKNLPKLKRLIIRNCPLLMASIDLAQFPCLTECMGVKIECQASSDLSQLTYMDLKNYSSLKNNPSLNIDKCELSENSGNITTADLPLATQHFILDGLGQAYVDDVSQKRLIQSIGIRRYPSRVVRIENNSLQSLMIEDGNDDPRDIEVKFEHFYRTELLSLKHLMLDTKSLSDLELSAPKLETVSIKNSSLKKYSLKTPLLRKLEINTSAEGDFTFDLTGCIFLREIILNGNHISFDINNPKITISLQDAMAPTKPANKNTAILKKRHKILIDSKTGLPTEASASSEGVKVSLKAQNDIDRAEMRYEIVERVYCPTRKEVQFLPESNLLWEEVPSPHGFSTFDSSLIDKLNAMAKSNPDTLSGLISGTFTGKDLEEIIGTRPIVEGSLLLYCDPPDAVKLFWQPDRQQYAIKSKNKNEKIKLLYYLKQEPSYEKEPTREEKIRIVAPNNLLPSSLYKTIYSYLNANKDSFISTVMLSKQFSLEERMVLLKQYCSDLFDNKALTNPGKTSLETLMSIIKERKGSCRHRSEAYMVLAHFLGVPVRMNINEDHQICETPYQLGTKTIWHGTDLGGAPIIDKTTASLRVDDFETKSENSPGFFSHEKKLTAAEEKEAAERILRKEAYYQQLEELVKPEPLSTVKTILDSGKRNALIQLNPKQLPIEIYREIQSQLKSSSEFDTHSQLLYINSPKEFIDYLGRYKVSDGYRRKIKNTPLTDMIAEQKSPGILVVNWSNFNANEIAFYKSILDTPPTLRDKRIGEKVLVIGLMTEGTAACSAFASRNKPYTLQPEFFSAYEEKHQAPPKQSEISLDLYHRTLWREEIYGRVKTSGDKLEFLPGKLFEAIEQNSLLKIFNPPRDPRNPRDIHPDFLRLVEQINIERKIYYNGKLIEVPSDMRIEFSEKPYDKKIATEVTILNHDEFKNDSTKEPIYLCLQNLSECIRQLIISKPYGHEEDGFLKQYKPHHYFYITDMIPAGDWQALMAEASKYPEKNFQFVLAPGAKIENLKSSPPDRHPRIRQSNDPDFCSKQLSAELGEAKIIYLTPQMSFKDLIFETTSHESEDKSMHFSHLKKGLLKALMAGETVVLNGSLSPALYQQLAPLMSSDDPHIYCNGERISITGKLYVVMPNLTPHRLPLVNLQQQNYQLGEHKTDQFEDYKAAFPPAEEKSLEKIRQFYQMANALTHAGKGMPTKPALSHQRLKNMLKMLKQKARHRHNPIKGIFHYDYPKDSSDYAYLNAVAKYLFNFQVGKDIAYTKLKTMLPDMNSFEAFDQWKLLNCFSGSALQMILGKELVSAIQFKNGVPFLSDEANTRLQLAVDNALKTPSVADEKKSAPQKSVDQLLEMIADPESPLVFLKGLTGVGKTTLVRSTCNKLGITPFEGPARIIDFLTDQSDTEKVLLLDEANMKEEGTWDFLKGLSADRKSVYYNGEFYPISNKHKVIVTGNPENYPNRSYHSFFQNHAETLYVKIPDDNYLENVVLKNILESKKLFSPNVAKQLLFAYHKVQSYNTFLPLSIRDLENLAQRFVFAAQQSSMPDINSILLSACLTEFAGVINNNTERQHFSGEITLNIMGKLTKPVARPAVTELLPGRYITRQKEYLTTAIEQDLLMRGSAKGYLKQAVLLEGDSGLGKSSLFRMILEKNAFSENNSDLQKRYYQVSAGDYSAHDVLIKAASEGAVVILDEVNLDETLEPLLNDLLTDPAALKRGFMVMGSQNASTESGRTSISDALRNRFHTVYMDKFSDDELKALAIAYKKSDPDAFVGAVKELFKKYPETSNQRTVYQALMAPDRLIRP
ncbi:MAG: hypothetical protein ABI370_11985, partial [Gammaproteobacteria bacterium]